MPAQLVQSAGICLEMPLPPNKLVLSSEMHQNEICYLHQHVGKTSQKCPTSLPAQEVVLTQLVSSTPLGGNVSLQPGIESTDRSSNLLHCWVHVANHPVSFRWTYLILWGKVSK